MSIEFKALARTPGRCALAGCTMEAKKIFEGNGLRILACTEGHAKAVETKLAKPPQGMDMSTYISRRGEALALFNELGGLPKEKEEDYDIDF